MEKLGITRTVVVAAVILLSGALFVYCAVFYPSENVAQACPDELPVVSAPAAQPPAPPAPPSAPAASRPRPRAGAT